MFIANLLKLHNVWSPDSISKVVRGLYIDRAQVEQELAARAAFLKEDLQNFWRTKGMEFIDLVGGDHAYYADLVEFGIEQVEEWLDRYTRRIDPAPPPEVDLAIMRDMSLIKNDDEQEEQIK